MAEAVILPKQGNSVESCIIQSWLKNVGDQVSAGDALCEVETDKAVVEVEATASGVLLEQFFPVEADVPVMTAIAAIGEAGEDVSSLRPDGAGAAAESAGEEPSASKESPAPASEPTPAAATPAAKAEAPAAAASGDAGSSPRARALAEKEALSLSSIAGTGPGGLVIERDVEAALAARPRLSPAAKAALQANPALVVPERGSGPDGLVRAEDLLAAGSAPAAASGPAPAAPAPGAVTDIPVKGIRKVIAKRMRASLSDAAQLTLNTSFDASAVQSWRARAKAQQEALGLPKISINDIILFAVSRVLPKFPDLNAHFLGDTIRQFADVHLGVAVDTPRGLLVPVLSHAHSRSLADIASSFKPLALAAIDGSIAAEHLSGGTFTVTNLGALGIEDFTPVLNVPEVAILGVGAPVLAPQRAADGSVVHVDRVRLSLTIDHQAVDGAPAAKFLQALVAALENIDVLLAQ
ncbi:MAG: 2-oxo acid dehydrogenase subunit E2 [Planctomycetota bacterium]|nr:MAG: 2-oxo acid dehydrogenase subunit E2 [Planctomycetota bacterium]